MNEEIEIRSKSMQDIIGYIRKLDNPVGNNCCIANNNRFAC